MIKASQPDISLERLTSGHLVARYKNLAGMVALIVWSIVFVGILSSVAIYGWSSFSTYLVKEADSVRSHSTFLVDMLFYSLMLLVAVCAFPGMSLVEMTCGFVLGFKEGFVVSFLALVSGACASFYIGRHYLRSHLVSYLEESEASTFKLFLRSIERKNGYILLILFRLMFVPLFVKNYGPSVIRTSFLQYFVAVLVTTPPFVALFTFIGSHIKSVADIANGVPDNGGPNTLNWIEIVPISVSIVAGMVFSVLAYLEFQTLKQREERESSEKLTTATDDLSYVETDPVLGQSVGA